MSMILTLHEESGILLYWKIKKLQAEIISSQQAETVKGNWSNENQSKRTQKLNTSITYKFKIRIMQHEKNQNKKQYTCPMHPEVRSDQPGKCSKCGMNLVEKIEAQKKRKS